MKRLAMLLPGLILALLLAENSFAQHQEQEKSDLRILYVGPNPNPDTAEQIRPSQTLTGKHLERKKKLALDRPRAYEAFLRRFFHNVKVMTSVDYQPSDSAAYDVTIFDRVPGFVAGQVRYVSLPRDFSKAAIMIGATGPGVLQQAAFDSKLDHL